MSRKSGQGVFENKLAAVALTIVGLAAGYFLGCVFSLQVASNWLDRYAKLWAAQDDASVAEARNLLGTLQDSPFAYCSDAEIAYFRGLISHTGHLKDAGRMRGGKIECSVSDGHQVRSAARIKPTLQQQDGIVVYDGFQGAREAAEKTTALQLGSAYVTFASELPASSGPIPVHLSATAKDSSTEHATQLPDQSPLNKVLNLFASGSGHLGDKLYSTRCSSLNTNCVTASTSIAEAAHGETSLVVGSTAAGGVLGVLLGMAVSFLFRRNRDMGQQLRRAILRDQIQLVYQPIVILSTRQIVGAEALARWTDKDGNVIDPEVFVKLAEESGFVGGLTKSVIHRALRDFARTLQTRPGFRLSVNVAGADLVDPTFLPMLDEALKQANVKPESLVIEISEKSTSKSEAAMETIRMLRRMGHSIHIDDFGTGYSNLDKLLYLFADTIKIDKAFTGVIGTESVAVAILPQILAMAKSLNLEVVVEGVETDRQANYFQADPPQIFGQGWLYGRPVSIDEFHELLAANLAMALAAAAYVPKPPVSALSEEEDVEIDPSWITKPGKLQIVGSRVA